MRERDKALAMGTAAGYGRYVRFACPAYSHAWIFFLPLGGFIAWSTTVDLVHIFSGQRGLWHGLFAPLGLVMAVLLIGCAFVSRYERRTGGPTPRLYCFENGVVVATGDVLRSFFWTELTIHRQEWRSGSGESADWGTRRIVMARDGTVLVTFQGNEPDRAGCWEMEQLHQAALERGPGDSRPAAR